MKIFVFHQKFEKIENKKNDPPNAYIEVGGFLYEQKQTSHRF